MEGKKLFHDKLKYKMDEYASFIYELTKNFPKEEIYGITSQLRRSSLSVILNYIEGFTRSSNKAYKNFLEISYGSLKESKYLLYFSLKQGYITRDNYIKVLKLSDKIGAMLWSVIKHIVREESSN